MRVVPILTDEAELPGEADLPADIAELSRCQYRYLRRRETTTDLARIVTDLTSHDPVLAAAARSRDTAPRQLPAAPRLFTGRGGELAALTDAVTVPAAPGVGATVVISAIGGTGGIGKTALALHWAHQHLHQFPDGQLYVNLRGFDPSGQPTPTGEAIRGFLDALGVDPAALPVELDTQAAKYRSLVAGRHMLILLDNARDIDQVTPLLPGSPTCTVLVTSRRRLAGLSALHGAHLVDLDVLPEPDARALLGRHLGRQRLAAEPTAARDLLAMCAGLPLAVAIVAARAAHHPTFPLAVLADELRDVSARLAGLNAGDLRVNVRAVLSWSVRTLSTRTEGLLGLLGIAPGPDISPAAAACLAALSTGQTREALQELENASLVQQYVPGRYRMHDLIRLYANDIARHDLALNVREAALRRVVDFYTHAAHAADRLLYSHRDDIQLDRPVAGVLAHPLPDHTAALQWLDIEHQCLLAAQRMAFAHHWDRTVENLAWSLHTVHRWRSHRHDELAVWQIGLAAADRLADPTSRIRAHRFLGRALARLGRYGEATEHLEQAIARAEQHHDLASEAHTHQPLALAWERLGDNQRALEHATRALRLFQRLGEPVWEAEALNSVGWYIAQLGDYKQARAHCQAALILLRQHPNPVGEANTRDSLGYIAHHAGDHAQAVDHYQHAVALYRDLGDVYEVANTLDRLGHSHVALGEHQQARTVWQEALHLYREQGRDDDAGRIEYQLGTLDHRHGAGESGE